VVSASHMHRRDSLIPGGGGCVRRSQRTALGHAVAPVTDRRVSKGRIYSAFDRPSADPDRRRATPGWGVSAALATAWSHDTPAVMGSACLACEVTLSASRADLLRELCCRSEEGCGEFPNSAKYLCPTRATAAQCRITAAMRCDVESHDSCPKVRAANPMLCIQVTCPPDPNRWHTLCSFRGQ
jgi:hypothetical protein